MESDKQRFSKAFYSSEAIRSAIKDYKKIASISYAEENGYYVCTFSKCITKTQRVIYEFNNYLIELMNSRGDNTES
ncbi:MAG: HxsD-like protein [Eubacteriales bacterium]|jgi:hypothetical protein